MSALNRRDPPRTPDHLASTQPSLYDCPLCGELPRGCECLRPSVRDRIADAIHFSPECRPAPYPFLVLEREPSLEPPPGGDGLAVA